jgi:hypothetical protein
MFRNSLQFIELLEVILVRFRGFLEAIVQQFVQRLETGEPCWCDALR